MINTDWKFHKGKIKDAYSFELDDREWENVSIPHTWNNIDGQDGTVGGKSIKETDYFRSDCWYRKQIFIDNEDKDKQIFLRFQGANIQIELFVNGNSVGTHKGGYTAFSFDITPFLHFGSSNLFAVKVNNEYTEEIAPLTADFTFYGGIYREIELIKKNKIHFGFGEYSTRGIKITTPVVSQEKAQCIISTRIENKTELSKRLIVTAKIGENESLIENPYLTKTDFDKLAKNDFEEEKATEILIEPNTEKEVEFFFEIKNPHLWNGRSDPFLYSASLRVSDNESIFDEISDTFGLRYFKMDSENGFYLTGKSYNLRGVSRHQDREGLGNAITKDEHNEDFAFIYDMGVNSIRLAHYPQAEYFYRLCDCYGIVVWAEIPVVDLIGGSGTYENPNDERKEFFRTTKNQLKEMIHQNYNHPSIVCWGIQNEIMARFDDVMQPFTKELHAASKAEDPYRYTTMATNHSIASEWESDLIAWNVYPGWYGMNRKQLGWFMDKNRFERPTGISEYGAGGNHNQHQLKPKRPKHNGQWHPEEYQSLSHEAFLKSIDERKYLWCTYVWNMFDFGSDGRNEGNRPGMNDKGLVSFDRKIKKDSYYLYQSNWSKNPMVHITSKRLKKRKRKTFFKIYSNSKAITLYINNKAIKTIHSNQNKQKGIFIFKGIKLLKGQNLVCAVAESKGSLYFDTAVFHR